MRIAAFDSGVGGLTAIAPLLKQFPEAHVSYLGDLANLPYGTKSPDRIRELTRLNLEWFLKKNSSFDVIVIACNTASAHAIEIAEKIGAARGTPVVGVIRPGCLAAVESQAKRVVVLATSATVESQSYLRSLQQAGAQGEIVQKACPLFVPLVEDELYEGPAVESIARRYLDEVLKPGDTVILGCTHYPFLLKTLKSLYPNMSWIDAGAALLRDAGFLAATKKASTKSASDAGLHLEFTQSLSEEKIQKFLMHLESSVLLKRLQIVRVSDA